MKLQARVLGDRFRIDDHVLSAAAPKKYGGTDLHTKGDVTITIHSLQKESQTLPGIRESCSFRHPNACETLAIFEEETQVCVVTERLPSNLLDEKSKKNRCSQPWEEDQLVNILVKITSVLKCAQERGLHHGNIRPFNIYTDDEVCIVKLSDFTSCPPPIEPRTTDMFLSPELRNQCADWNAFKCDVFALGMVMLYLVQPMVSDIIIETDISKQLQTLNYSPKFARVISRMLELDAKKRPDATGVAILIEAEWPEYRHLFNVPIFCSVCGNLSPAYTCLCAFPSPLLCVNCWSCHSDDGRSHYAVTVEMHKWIASELDLCRIRDNYEILTTVSASLTDSLQSIEECRDRCRIMMQDCLKDVTRQFEQVMEELQRVKDRNEQVKCDIDTIFWQKIAEFSVDQAQIINNVERPYFSVIQCSCIPPSVEYSEQITALEAALTHLRFPLFYNSQLFVYAETAELCSTQSLPEAVDNSTSLLILNNREVFGCGGDSRPTRCFRVLLDTSTCEELANSINPRKFTGLALLANRVYLFGGYFAEKSTEVHSLFHGGTQVPLKDMRYPRARFNPCVSNALIYLPGAYIETYCPKSDTYSQVISLSCPFDTATAVVCDGRFYIFTNNYALSKSIEAPGNPHRSDQNAVKFLSNPAPLLLGKCLYLFNPEKPTILRLRLGRLNIKSEIVVSM